MRLGFHYHIPFHLNADHHVTVPGYLGRFLDSLASQVDELVCFMHSAVSTELKYSDYQLQAPNLRWVNMGPHSSVPERMLHVRRYIRVIERERRNLDAILIRGPSPLLPAMAFAASDLPVALLIVGDYLAGIDDLPQPRWRKEVIRFWSSWNYFRQVAAARGALTFVNSRKLYEQLHSRVPNLVETRTTTLNETDFYQREDTCQSSPIRLLYTGRMDRAKGLFEMVEAVDILLKLGYDVILDLVGWPARGDTIVEELLLDASARGVGHLVFYHGFKPVGPELFAHYRQADFYLIGSQSTEGFPRTIWEAMAHSLPVIATKVGSIPSFLEDRKHALLVEPRQPKALARAVTELLSDGDLRRTMIQSGLALASENTLDKCSKEYVFHIERWIDRP